MEYEKDNTRDFAPIEKARATEELGSVLFKLPTPSHRSSIALRAPRTNIVGELDIAFGEGSEDMDVHGRSFPEDGAGVENESSPDAVKVVKPVRLPFRVQSKGLSSHPSSRQGQVRFS